MQWLGKYFCAVWRIFLLNFGILVAVYLCVGYFSYISLIFDLYLGILFNFRCILVVFWSVFVYVSRLWVVF